MSTSAKKATPARPKAGNVGAWQQLGVHTVTLPSGMVVKIRIPDLATLLAGGAVPENLRTTAFQEVTRAISGSASAVAAGLDPAEAAAASFGEIDDTRMQALAALHRYLICQTLVEPQITPDELEVIQTGDSPLPAEDLEMLNRFASRQQVVDAKGVRLGIDPLSRWEIWRIAHECPEECEHCKDVLDVFSSTAVAS